MSGGGLTEGENVLLTINKKYLRAMRNYILENKFRLHHTFWCINIDSADTGGLLTRGEGSVFPGGRDLKWNDNKYENYLLPVLWKNDVGRFIGLDHEIPLGNNGVTVKEYYGGNDGNDEKKGDLNNDNKINSQDYTLMRRYVMNIIDTKNNKLADLNCDGDINSIDYTLMRRYILKIISSF